MNIDKKVFDFMGSQMDIISDSIRGNRIIDDANDDLLDEVVDKQIKEIKEEK